MTTQSYVKKNLSLAWPLALNALLMQSMLMIDTFLVSPLGEISLAAMGIASTIVFFVLGIQIALANGTQLVLSRAFGSGGEQSLRKGLWSGMSINLSVAILFFVLIKLFDHHLIALLTDDIKLMAEVQSYLDVSMYIVLFNAITQVMIAFFNAVGRTKIPFKGYLLELPINVCASYLLIFGVGDWGGLGVQGAAAGSLIAISVRMLYLGLCVKYYHATLLDWTKLDASLRSNMLNHFKEIFPVAANMAMLQVGATLYMLILSQLPLSAYVAITLIMPWVRAGTQFITAWAHSAAITVSQSIGSGQMGDLRKNVDVSIDIAVVISLFSALLFAGLSLALPHIYTELDDATYYALMAIAPLYIFLPIVRGYNTVHGHVLRALGKTTAVFKINFTGQWLISIPLCAFIVFGLDGSLFWAFSVFAIEEMVKMLPFRYLARKSLDEFDMSKAEKLMYD